MTGTSRIDAIRAESLPKRHRPRACKSGQSLGNRGMVPKERLSSLAKLKNLPENDKSD